MRTLWNWCKWNKMLICKNTAKAVLPAIGVLCITLTSTIDAAGNRFYQNIFQSNIINVFYAVVALLTATLMIFAFSFRNKKLNQSGCWLLTLMPSLLLWFFTFPIVTTWDTVLYHVMCAVLEGRADWALWDSVRGIGFPLFLTVVRAVFGPTRMGMLTAMFLVYLLFLIYAIRVLELLGLKTNEHKKFYFIFALLVCFNPLIVGGFHALLCEFIGATITIMSVYYALRWSATPRSDVKKQIFYYLYFAVMSIIAYQLKQTYIAATIFPLCFAALIAWRKNMSWKELGVRAGAIALSGGMVICSILTWSAYIAYMGVDLQRAVKPESLFTGLSRNLVQLVPEGKALYWSENKIEKDPYFDEDEIELLTHLKDGTMKGNRCSEIFTVVDWEGNVIDREVMLKQTKVASTKEELRFLGKQIMRNPRAVISSWIKNYLGLANVVKVGTVDNISMHIPTSEISSNFGNENVSIFCRSSFLRAQDDNIIFSDPLFEKYQDIELYETIKVYQHPVPVSWSAATLNQLSLSLFAASSFRWITLLFPLTFIASLIAVLKKRQGPVKSMVSEVLLIGSSYAFLQTLIHTIFLMAIDRYVFASYTTMLILCLGSAAILYYKNQKNSTFSDL